MPSLEAPASASSSLSPLLQALPLAAARLVVGAAGERSLIAETNAEWRRFFARSDPHLATADGTAELADLAALLVEPALRETLHRRVAAGESFGQRLAVDRDGPELLEACGCRVGEDYLLLLRPCAEPGRVAQAWPGGPVRATAPTGFTYLAALAADGGWRVSASVPDYRPVLGLDAAATDHWLAHAEPGAGRRLRSAFLGLLAGRPQRSTYRLRLAGDRILAIEDSAEPLRHPETGEVIGSVGEVRLIPPEGATEAAASPPAAAALPAVVEALEALGLGALLFDPQGRLEVAGRAALAELESDAATVAGSTIASLLGADQAVADRLLATLSEAEADAVAGDPGLDLPLPLQAPPVPEESRPSPGLRARIRPLCLAGERHLLVTIARDSGSDQRVRDALYFDNLTGLPNRFLFLDRLRQSLARAAANDASLAVLVVEIERLALIERSFGRAAAEALATSVAGRFAGCMGGRATTARLGDDRFGVIADELGGIDDAARLAQTLLDQLRLPVDVAGREIGIAGRIGIAFYPHDGDEALDLTDLAETALGRLPQGRSNAFQFYNREMNDASSDRLMLEQQLAQAVERGELVLVYQPQISFATSRIVGMEALIRWRHPELGMVSPAEFIPLAEETGAIVAIGEWVLEAACRELVGWFADGVAPLRLAINVSGRQYNDAGLVPAVERILEATGFPPHLLELELTETMIMEDVVEAAKRLGDLHRLGISLAVDDFGTGYSSLSYLKRFPIHSLKLDRSFVRDIAYDETSASIARAIIAFGSALGLKVIAEGVESYDQYDILRAAGCDELQGYLFSRPIAPEDARHLALERRHLSQVRG